MSANMEERDRDSGVLRRENGILRSENDNYLKRNF